MTRPSPDSLHGTSGSGRLFPQPSSPHLHGAADRNRTRNLLFTKQLLCQLSYGGVNTILPVSALWPTFRSGMEVSGSGKNVHVALFYVALIILAFDVLVALFG